FLFLALGTTVANAIGENTPLFIPENGLISLNVPLTSARSGTLSTRTTHPFFISLYEELLDSLGIPIKIEMPYRFCTKGEILQNAKGQTTLQAGARVTMSCARPSAGRYQKRSPGKHCGYCVPCLIRRAAMKTISLDIAQDYSVDVLEPGINAHE